VIKVIKTILGQVLFGLQYNAMEQVGRPEGDEAWEFYDSTLKLLGKQERVLE
jgi:penicillin-binding protein 1C